MCWSGHQGMPGFPGDRSTTPCCGEYVKYSSNKGYYCPNCDLKIKTNELVSINEFKSINRTKLIDKFLNE